MSDSPTAGDTDVDLPEEVVVSMRCDDLPVAVPGSTRRPCLACGRDVWISPATQQSIDRGIYPDDVVCVPCAADSEGEP